MSKIALVDLDRVLFNVGALKFRYFEVLGVLLEGKCTMAEILASYANSKMDSIYDVDRHIVLLSETALYPIFDLRKKIESFMRREATQFVYYDAELFLQRLVELGYEIWIVTAGIEWFQEDKIPVDFYRCIVGVKVTQDPQKVSTIREICDPTVDDVLLFDDSWRVIDKVKQVFPKITAIQVLREHDVIKQAARADAMAKNLEEAIGALLSQPR